MEDFYAAYRNFTGDLTNYKEIVIDIIKNLKAYNVEIGSIIAYNLPVQKADIDPSSQNSFQFQSSHQDNFPVLYFPCIAHTVSLGIKDALQCENLSNIQNDIYLNFQNTFRTKPICTEIKEVCPSYCPTRWFNLFEICKWAIK